MNELPSDELPSDEAPRNEASGRGPTNESRESSSKRTDAMPLVVRLDDFLKRRGLVGTGGEAKIRIQSGEVIVNGAVETRRRKQMAVGDVVQAVGETMTVTADCFE